MWRAQVIHQHQSGLPRDTIVNTFHVEQGPSGTPGTLTQLAGAFRDFYTSAPTGRPGPLCELFGDQVANSGHEVRIYELVEATGERVVAAGSPPEATLSFNHGSRVGTAMPGLPSEVAVCLSMKSNTPATTPLARRRGRVYIGPLATSAVVAEDATSERPLVATGFRDQLIAGGVDLAADLAALNYELTIYSRPYEGRDEIVRPGRAPLPAIAARAGLNHKVNQFWVDDAFDTVRRRGERAVARTLSAVI